MKKFNKTTVENFLSQYNFEVIEDLCLDRKFKDELKDMSKKFPTIYKVYSNEFKKQLKNLKENSEYYEFNIFNKNVYKYIKSHKNIENNLKTNYESKQMSLSIIDEEFDDFIKTAFCSRILVFSKDNITTKYNMCDTERIDYVNSYKIDTPSNIDSENGIVKKWLLKLNNDWKTYLKTAEQER